MKRIVNYIKNLFGADLRLRKWCTKRICERGATISALDYSRPYRTVHPLLALGLAMADIDNTYYSASVNISTLRIEKI